MRESYSQLQQKLKFDVFMKILDEAFQQIAEHRKSNTRYRLPNVLKAAFAMFSLKAPSLLNFKKQSDPEANNLRSIYLLTGEIPCDSQMRATLDPVPPGRLRALLRSLFLKLKQAGVIRDYYYWGKFAIVSMDGVEHFCSTKIHCAHCTTRTHRNGQISYHHSGLAAVLVHPAHSEVFPLDFEPILKEDGAQKNDCERNAAKRLCAALDQDYPELDILVVEDALHANAPHLRQIAGYGWKYVVNVKPDSHESLFKQFAGRVSRGDVSRLTQTTPDGVEHRYTWTNHLCLNEGALDVNINFLQYEEIRPDGQLTTWTWVTNLPLTKRTVERVMRAGRSRWKIENETFNTLKNQGYHFEHNYGHGVKNLATNLALLMFLAFLVDQIQQRCCKTFQRLRKGLGAKTKLWEALRSAFQMLTFPSMENLFRHIALVYRIQLE